MTDPVSVLELRIHGVNNTAPADMLELSPDRVRQIDGDGLGSFWAPAPGALDDARRGMPAWVPAGVRREAYSWGGLARTSITGGSGAIGSVTAALGRVGWAMVLPFGLANVAYWTRRLDTDPTADAALPGSARRDGRGASLSRLFGLLLTCLFVVTVSEVALDLFAVQCFSSGNAAATRCSRLPWFVDALARWTAGQRLALASLAPLLGLLGLRQLANVSASRYEAVSVVEREQEVAAAGTPGVLLSRGDFWTGRSGADAAASLHIAAGICLVVLGTAWPAAVGGGRYPSWPYGVVAGAALLLLLVVIVVHCVRSADAPDVAAGPTVATRRGLPSPALLLVAGGVLLTVQIALLVSLDATFAQSPAGSAGRELPLPGLSFTPAVIILLALLVALSGLGWRGAQDRGAAMWRGRAPGLLMLLALWTATVLSALLVLTVGNWLNGTRGAGDLLAGDLLAGDLAAGNGSAQPDISVPSTYLWFGAASVLAVLLLLLPVGVLLGLWWRQAPPAPARALAGLTLDRLPYRRSASRRALLRLEDTAATLGPARLSLPGDALLAPAAVARRRAAIAQHAEWLVLVVALVAGLALGLAVVGSAVGSTPGEGASGPEAVVRWSLDAGITAVAAIGTLIVGGLVGGGAMGGQRPLGFVWDLMCFLPRAAHPLGPPCYAERAVPEITRRVRWWLDGEGVEPDAPAPRHVVLSAHSLGCVLAAAAVCGLPAADPPAVSLLTYGCQFRGYFSRLFPELLGPRVLGTPPCPEPALASLDPWPAPPARQVQAQPVPAQPVPGVAEGSVRARLGGTTTTAPRWVNLWRRTDYLGFPVVGWEPAETDPGNDVDRPAEEIDTSGYVAAIATHSNYPRTLAYLIALEDLLARAGN